MQTYKGSVGRITRGVGSNKPKIRLVSTGTKVPAAVMAEVIAKRQSMAVNPVVNTTPEFSSNAAMQRGNVSHLDTGGVGKNPQVMHGKNTNPPGVMNGEFPPLANEIGRNQGKFKGGSGKPAPGMHSNDPSLNNTSVADRKPMSAAHLGVMKLKNDMVFDRRKVTQKLRDATKRTQWAD